MESNKLYYYIFWCIAVVVAIAELERFMKYESRRQGKNNT